MAAAAASPRYKRHRFPAERLRRHRLTAAAQRRERLRRFQAWEEATGAQEVA